MHQLSARISNQGVVFKGIVHYLREGAEKNEGGLGTFMLLGRGVF